MGLKAERQWKQNTTVMDNEMVSVTNDHLADLVVKASASGPENPGFESACGRIFPGRIIPVT